jgi:Ni/Co efflux regulator RcnB
MRNRIRQRMLSRIALAFAVAAVAAPTAQAHPLEPGATEVKDYGRQHIVVPRGNTAPHGKTIQGGEYGMPTAMPSDYAANRGDRIENVRLHARNTDDLRGSDRVENVRVEPRGLDKPVLVVSDGSSFNWGDAGIGAGLAFAAILLAGAVALSVRQSNRLGQV